MAGRISVKKSISAQPKATSMLTGKTKHTISKTSGKIKSEQHKSYKYSSIDGKSIISIDISDNESIELPETKKLLLPKKTSPTLYFNIICGKKLEKFIEDYYPMKESSK